MEMDRPIAIVLFALALYGCVPEARLLAGHTLHPGAAVKDAALADLAAGECIRRAAPACSPVEPGPDCTPALVADGPWPGKALHVE